MTETYGRNTTRSFFGALALCSLLPAERAEAVTCDGTEVLCLNLSTSGEVTGSGGTIVGGSFEGGGFRPAERGGIDWSWGSEVDLSEGRIEFDITGLRPTTGGDTGGGKRSLFDFSGNEGGVNHGVGLQKMAEDYRDGHNFRYGMDDDGLADNWDAVVITATGFPCGSYTIDDWGPNDTHHIEATWGPTGVTLKIDDWYCSQGGNGDTFDPSDKTFTLGQRFEKFPAQHADAVFRNLRLWAKSGGGGDSQPTAVIESITPNPAVQGAGPIVFNGYARDNDDGGQAIDIINWRSSIDGQIGHSEDLVIDAALLSPGTHQIKLRIRDDEGNWVEDASSVTILAEGEGPLTIQLPTTYDAVVARGAKGDPDESYGFGDQLMVGADGIGFPDEVAFLRFNLGGVKGSLIDATLSLRGSNDGGSLSLYETSIFRRDGPVWDETNLTWNNAPFPGPTVVATVGSVQPETWYELDVSDITRLAEPNAMMLISTASNGAGFKSKEHPDAGEEPILTVRYYPAIFHDGFDDGGFGEWTAVVEPQTRRRRR